MKRKRASQDETARPDTREFDQEFVIDTFHPLSDEDKKRWKRVQSKLARPVNGKQRGKIAIHVDKTLLDQVDTLATKLHVSRETLITRGIKAVLAAVNG